MNSKFSIFETDGLLKEHLACENSSNELIEAGLEAKLSNFETLQLAILIIFILNFCSVK